MSGQGTLTCFLESEASLSPRNGQDSGQSPSAKPICFANKSYESIGQKSQLAQTFDHSLEYPPISSLADSPAKTSASPETALVWRASAQDSGENFSELFATYDQNSRWWKTSQLYLFEDFSKSLETSPRSGSMRNGQIFLRAPWAQHTCDSDCSLWPTPNGFNGWQRIRDTVASKDRQIQALNGFKDSRASWKARLANPSELYGGADGVANRMERNHAIGNAIVPQVAFEILKAIRTELV